MKRLAAPALGQSAPLANPEAASKAGRATNLARLRREGFRGKLGTLATSLTR